MIPSEESSHVFTQTALFYNAGHDYCFHCGGKVERSYQGIKCTDAEFVAARFGASLRWIALVRGPADE